MNVRDIMSSPVTTILPETKVAEIGRLMLDQGLRGLPVVDLDGRFLGMVTERDLVAKHARPHLPTYFGILGTWVPINTRAADEDMRRVLAVTARDLMEAEPITVSADTQIDDAASLMVNRSVDVLPVLEDGRLIGIMRHGDIIRLLLHEEGDAG